MCQIVKACPICHDCGKTVIPDSPYTTGYGYWKNPATNQKELVCFACCALRDSKAMIEGNGKYTLYLAMEDNKPAEITNWPGTLRFKVSSYSIGRHNIAGKRYDVWFRGPDGFIWHGVQYGDNTQIVHMRRTKKITWF